MSIRKSGGRGELDAMWQQVASLNLRLNFSHSGSPAIANGTTAGKLKTVASVTGNIAGIAVTKGATDDLWDLSAKTDTTSSQYRAYWLYISSAGAASVGEGANASTAALALAALPAQDVTKCIFGVYVAGPSTDFNGAGGLAAQGTIYNNLPTGVPIGVKGELYIAPAAISVVSG